jgi:sugar phosphate isomerase/epimerase
MKLSCLPVSFFADLIAGRMTIGEWARMGAEIGLDGIDLSILFLPERTPEAAREVRRQVEAEGMRVAMITTYPDFTHPNPAQRQVELEQECRAVALAAELGAALIRVTAGQAHPETSLEDGIRWAVEGLERLSERAGGLGVRLVYENHAKPGIWQYTDFCQPPPVFLEILSRVVHPALGVNFDLGNAATYADDPLAMLEQVLPRIVSIHASDSSERGQLKHTLLGTGVTPYPKMFRQLKQASWDGWICMEEGSFRGREGVALAAEFIRCTWENTNPSGF